jgi:hypothetical protein
VTGEQDQLKAVIDLVNAVLNGNAGHLCPFLHHRWMGFGVRIARMNFKHKENPVFRPAICAEPLGISVKSGINVSIARKIHFQG